jgi:hypothetical protein
MNITSAGITLISILLALALAVAIMSFLVYLVLTIFSWIETKRWRW